MYLGAGPLADADMFLGGAGGKQQAVGGRCLQRCAPSHTSSNRIVKSMAKVVPLASLIQTSPSPRFAARPQFAISRHPPEVAASPGQVPATLMTIATTAAARTPAGPSQTPKGGPDSSSGSRGTTRASREGQVGGEGLLTLFCIQSRHAATVSTVPPSWRDGHPHTVSKHSCPHLISTPRRLCPRPRPPSAP